MNGPPDYHHTVVNWLIYLIISRPLDQINSVHGDCEKKKRTQQSNLDEQDTWRQRYDSRKNSRHLISSEQGDSAE